MQLIYETDSVAEIKKKLAKVLVLLIEGLQRIFVLAISI